MKPLYAFLDEGGNFDFSPNGTPLFTMTSVWGARPFPFDAAHAQLRYNLIEAGQDIQRFHASDDSWSIRNAFFDHVVRASRGAVQATCVVVEKASVPEDLRPVARLYPEVLGRLLGSVIDACGHARWSEVIVITDSLPMAKKREAITKGIKTNLASRIPQALRYRVLHHDSRSSAGLQLADYVNWSVHRHQTSSDEGPFARVRDLVHKVEKVRFGLSDPSKK